MQVFGHDQSIRKTVPEVCLLSNHVINFVYGRWGNLVKTMNQQWLAPVNLQPFIDTIHASESPLDNCWVFIDGIVRPICRPRKDQRILHNGHKKVHAIKFQSVVARNGLIANLYGPAETITAVCLVTQAYFAIFSSMPMGRTTTLSVCMAIRRTLFDHSLWVLFKLQQ